MPVARGPFACAPSGAQGSLPNAGGRFSRKASRPSLVSSVPYASQSGLTGEDLLAHQAVIDQVEGELEHALRGGGLESSTRVSIGSDKESSVNPLPPSPTPTRGSRSPSLRCRPGS